MDRTSRARAPRAARPMGHESGPHAAVQASQYKLIEHSHQRCEALGLSRIERPDYSPLMRSDIVVARERNQRLFTHAAPVMEMLFEQIAGTESMIVLTDAQGTILHSVGDDDFLDRAGKVALTPGVSWAEHSKGTNAIGTTLFEEAPTLVHADQHFMHANEFLTCSAAPIFDPRGNMLGVLDVSGDQRSYHQHTMGLVRVSARMIENHWLSDDCSDRLRLHFHSRAEFIGSLLEGIIVVRPEGKILGSNRSALDQLSLNAAALRRHTLDTLLGTSVTAVMDHFRLPSPAPLRLNLPHGQPLYVMARLQWGPRPVFGARSATRAAAALASPLTMPRESTAPVSTAQAAEPASKGWSLHQLQTGDPQVEALIGKVRRVLNRAIPTLILGETGAGKEVLARAIHHDSHRAGQPFVAVNCAAIPESLIEAELFGDEGAPGSIVQAHGGTLLLDEIGDMPPALQARLLRVLQEREVKPLGSQRAMPVDVAVIAATHRNLRQLIDRQLFREDLYYRLNGLSMRLPALRERTDLAELARRILLTECPRGAPEISASVMALFHRAAWPGNIRQLVNVLRIAAVMTEGVGRITEAHLPEDFLEEVRCAAPLALADTADPSLAATADPPTSAPTQAAAPTLTMKDAERETIRAALAAADGNISVASRRLGICRNTIYRKLYWKQGR